MNETDDLELNGIVTGSIAEWIYKEYRASGLNHKEAVVKTVDAINSLKSSSFDEPMLERLKQIFFSCKGNWV